MPTYTISSGIRDTDDNEILKPAEQSYTPTNGNTYKEGARSIATTEVEITLPSSITTAPGPGMVIVRNTDPTNYVEFGTATTVYGDKIPPNQELKRWIQSSVTSLFLKANTAACVCEIHVVRR